MHLAVRRTFSREIPSELLNYRLDLGVVSFVPQEPQLAAVKIFRDELAFVVSPQHGSPNETASSSPIWAKKSSSPIRWNRRFAAA